ncbi:MAG: hypothetical protein ACJ71Z_13270 [Aeromicrobium sp.]
MNGSENRRPMRPAYWVAGPGGCPIGGPFDLWRKNYFIANGEPPEDTVKMYPALSQRTVTGIAEATFTWEATLEDVLQRFTTDGPHDQLTMAYSYFHEWRKRAPFLPDSMQDIALRPARTEPEPLDGFMEDWRLDGPARK